MSKLLIYELIIDINYIEPGDYLKIGNWENKFSDIFATGRAATRVCQSKFARQPLNKCITAVHAQVNEITITEKGIEGRKRIYNKYKKKENESI